MGVGGGGERELSVEEVTFCRLCDETELSLFVTNLARPINRESHMIIIRTKQD